MRYMRPLLSILALQITTALWSQEGVEQQNKNAQYAPSPKAMEMIRYGHLSSNLNGGTMEFDLPFYTLEDKDFNVPISLHYSSGGFRPNQQTGEAGLGWTLMVGGAITREIVGVDDFMGSVGITNVSQGITESQIYTLNGTVSYPSGEPTFPYISQQKETTSDVYHFTMPGHSGNFVFHKESRKFLAYGTNDGAGLYDIVYDSTGDYFTIKTGDGYEYQFSDSLKENVERNFTRLPKESTESGRSLWDSEKTVVTWLLVSIKAPNGRKVQFEYMGAAVTNTIPQSGADVVTTFSTHLSKVNNVNYYKRASLTSTRYLTRIDIDKNLPNQKTALFSWQLQTNPEIYTSPTDEYTALVKPTRKLQGIQITCNGQTIRQASLTYTDWGHRPLLSSVTITGLGNYSFQYNTGNISNPPDITTNEVDFWGFYNGRGAPLEFISPMEVDANDDEVLKTGITYRNPDWQKACLGMLTRITYPTGGYTDVEYEANRASKIVLRRRFQGGGGPGPQPSNPSLEENPFLPSLFNFSILFGTETECGGVRVRSLTDTDLLGDQSTRTFDYINSDNTSSGIVQQFPRYYVGAIGTNTSYNQTIHFPGSSFDTRHIAYSRVVENGQDGSMIVSEFSDWNTNPDTFSNTSQTGAYGLAYNPSLLPPGNDGTAETEFWNNILREPDSKAYRRGLLANRTWKDANNRTVRSETYTYADYYRQSSNELYSAYIVGSGQYWWSARREICDRRPYQTVITYYADTGTLTQTETQTYSYDLLGNRIKTTRSVTGVGSEEERVSYSGSMTNGTIYAGMQAAHLLQLPVERTKLRNGKVIQSILTTYDCFSDLYLPAASYKAELGEGVASFSYFSGGSMDSHYGYAEITYNKYDSWGNLKQSRNRTGIPTSIVYDTLSRRPAAVFFGAENGQKVVHNQSTALQTVSYNVSNESSYTVQFSSTSSGTFSFFFTGVIFNGDSGNTGGLTATLDGNSITLSKLSGPDVSTYSYSRGSNNPLPTGSHTIVLTAGIGSGGFTPADPLGQGGPAQPRTSNWEMTGTVSVSYTVAQQDTVIQHYTSVFFENFEVSGTSGAGVGGSKGLTSGYSKTIAVEAEKSYILGYLLKTGTEWFPVYIRKTPSTNGTVSFTVTGSSISPIDQLVLFPEDALGETYSWSMDGKLLSRTTGGGQTEWYTYDTESRLTGVWDTDYNPVTSYAYSIGGAPSTNHITERTHTGTGQNNYRSERTYYDGLGRPFEKLQSGAWMNGMQVQGDIVSLQEYDSSGRPYKSWLPVGNASQGYMSPDSFKTTVCNQYADTVSYSRTLYDNSPLDRVREESGPGSAWRISDKKISYADLLNTSDGGDLSIRQYTITYSGNTGAVITKGDILSAGTCFVKETVDEDGRRVLIFTDMFGETVLERRFLAGTGNTQEKVDTYYCYDDAGRLAGVLPPMLSSYLNNASGTSFTLSGTSEVANYAYLYRYDSRNNMIAKKLPGAEWIYYVYDQGDRPVFTQDGNQRQSSKWTFRLTDKLERPCLTGTCSKTLDAFSNTLQGTVVEVTRNYPSLSTTDSYYGYIISGVSILQPDILSVNWYGDYSFLGKWNIPSAETNNSATGFDSNAPSQGYGQVQSTLENGMLTGCLEQIVGNASNNPYIWAVMYYDNRGRTVQTTRRNPMGSWDKTNIGYSYTGQPLLSRTVRFNGTKAFAERYSYTYDGWDRPLAVSHALSNLVSLQTGEYTYGTSSQLHDYRYDHAGRMVLDNRNATDALKTSYGYNVRSWAESIAYGWNASNSAYGSTFLENLRYQTVQSPSQNGPQWGGNISSMDWKCGNDNVTRTYDFSYDALSRITAAAYRDSQNNNGTYGRSYSYDRQGNILSVTTPSGTVSASYSGNRRSGSGYTYDSNGNMTANPDANLSGMTYNVLNLLSGYTNGANGYQTTFEYSASGEKMAEVIKNGGIISFKKNYVGDVIYEDSFNPTRLLIDGGYVDITSTFSSMSYVYRFYVQDHQGNNRMVTDASGNVLQVNHYDPYGQMLTAISSTTAVSEYKYGGKEWISTSLGYDFGARNYLPAIPRWNSMDPLAEKYYSLSPYVYCAGNPVNLVDRDGKSTGDYYSFWGYYVGNDNLDDGKLYLVDDLIITNYLRIDPRYVSFEENYFTLSNGAVEIDGLIVVERQDVNEQHTQGEFSAIGEDGFSGYTMERPGPPTTTPNLKKPIPKGFYETDALSIDFAGNFAFQIYNSEVPKSRKIYGHVGNSPTDSSGCILFGMGKDDNNAYIINSHKAMNHFRSFYSGKESIKLIVR